MVKEEKIIRGIKEKREEKRKGGTFSYAKN